MDLIRTEYISLKKDKKDTEFLLPVFVLAGERKCMAVSDIYTYGLHTMRKRLAIEIDDYDGHYESIAGRRYRIHGKFPIYCECTKDSLSRVCDFRFGKDSDRHKSDINEFAGKWILDPPLDDPLLYTVLRNNFLGYGEEFEGFSLDSWRLCEGEKLLFDSPQSILTILDHYYNTDVSRKLVGLLSEPLTAAQKTELPRYQMVFNTLFSRTCMKMYSGIRTGIESVPTWALRNVEVLVWYMNDIDLLKRFLKERTALVKEGKDKFSARQEISKTNSFKKKTKDTYSTKDVGFRFKNYSNLHPYFDPFHPKVTREVKQKSSKRLLQMILQEDLENFWDS